MATTVLKRQVSRKENYFSICCIMYMKTDNLTSTENGLKKIIEAAKLEVRKFKNNYINSNWIRFPNII